MSGDDVISLVSRLAFYTLLQCSNAYTETTTCCLLQCSMLVLENLNGAWIRFNDAAALSVMAGVVGLRTFVFAGELVSRSDAPLHNVVLISEEGCLLRASRSSLQCVFFSNFHCLITNPTFLYRWQYGQHRTRL